MINLIIIHTIIHYFIFVVSVTVQTFPFLVLWWVIFFNVAS